MHASELSACANTSQRITDRFAAVRLPNCQRQAAAYDPPRIPDRVQEIPSAKKPKSCFISKPEGIQMGTERISTDKSMPVMDAFSAHPLLRLAGQPPPNRNRG